MTETESLRQVAQARTPFSAWFGILLLFMLFGAIVLALLGPSARTDNYEQNKAKKRVDLLKTLREEDAKALNAYAWIDKAKGSARIPIDRAMQLTTVELAQKKPAPAYPIATPTPAPAVAPSPAVPAAKAPAAGSPSPAASQPPPTS
jgi:hypothetical protein